MKSELKNRVLLASADASFRRTLTPALEGSDFVVFVADTGGKALRILRENLVDVVVLDYHMPFTRYGAKREPSAVLQAITDACALVPVVLVCDEAVHLEHADFLMADMVLTEPVEYPALLEAMTTVLTETLTQRAQRKAGDFGRPAIFYKSKQSQPVFGYEESAYRG